MICDTNKHTHPMLFIPAVEQSISCKNIFEKKYAIYINIPFCMKKCSFCAIPTMVMSNEKVMDNYLNTMMDEMKKWRKYLAECKITSVHIGGGTPSILSTKQIKKLLDAVIEIFGRDIPEITFESHPETLTLEKIDILSEYDNITINMGIQSFIPERLIKINRYSNIEETKKIIRYIRKKRKINFGIDLIVGLPGAKNGDYDIAIDYIKELNIRNVFIYPFRIEENSFFYKNKSEKLFVDTYDIISQMNYFEKLVSECGFRNETIYYWTKERKSLYLYTMHQISGEEWVGIGAGAYSYINTTVIQNELLLEKYVHEYNNIGGCILIQNVTSQLIWDMLFMIKNKTFDLKRISMKYGKIATEYIRELTKILVKRDYCEVEDNKIRLKVKGKVMLDEVEIIVREIVLS